MMKRYRRVWVVYRKELIETLRDRRTLIAMVLVPILLYPALMVVLVEALRTETGRRQQEEYRICVPTQAHKVWLEEVMEREDLERGASIAYAREAAIAAGEEPPDEEGMLWAFLKADQLTIDVVGKTQSLWDEVESQACHAGLIVEPEPVAHNLGDGVNRIAQIVYCDTDSRSEYVYNQLDLVLRHEARRTVEDRVIRLSGGIELLAPLIANSISTASPAEQFAKILAMVIPFLLVTMTVTGAMYPAIDLTAGERERGTLETLAVSPVPVGQIVAGKFAVIVTIAMISTALNLASMTAMVHFTELDELASSMAPSRQAEVVAVEKAIQDTSVTQGDSGFSQLDYLARRVEMEQLAEQKLGLVTSAAPIVLLAMVPFAVLFSGVMLAACSFARTFKEAQNYMMPVMMAAILPAMVVSYMPSIELEGVILVVPVANIVVLIRELMLGNYDIPAIAVALGSTCFYAVAAVAVAAKLYGSEAVLFSDVGSYKTLLRRRFIKPKRYPAAAVALLTVAVIFPINFYWQSSQVNLESSTAQLQWVIATAQLFIFAAPVLFLAWYTRLNIRRTFSLRLPSGINASIGTLLLAVSIVPMSLLLKQLQDAIFGAGTGMEALRQQAEAMQGGSLWVALLVFAVLPGICEEILFRGYLLAGIRDRLSLFQTVLVVAVIFGLFHVQIEKIPVVTLLGMLLAFVCLRSGSLYPAILIHIANNGLAIALAREMETGSGPLQSFLFGVAEMAPETEGIHFNVRTLTFVAVFIVGLVLVALARQTHDGTNVHPSPKQAP